MERISATTAFDSVSPKTIDATCPAGKQAIAADYDIAGGKTGVPPNTLLEVVVDQVGTFANQGFAGAYETDVTTEDWSLSLGVLCAQVSP